MGDLQVPVQVVRQYLDYVREQMALLPIIWILHIIIISEQQQTNNWQHNG
jgi:hypothetical protein